MRLLKPVAFTALLGAIVPAILAAQVPSLRQAIPIRLVDDPHARRGDFARAAKQSAVPADGQRA